MGCMWQHLLDNHETQTKEGIVNQHRAAKMYAMNWTEHTETMTHLKHQWRQQMLIGMSVTTRGEYDTPERYAADAAAADPTGSNAKKSERNRSN